MRFIIAPDWLMAKKDDDLLCTKQVLDLYGYAADSKSASGLCAKGHLPMPDKPRQQGRRRLLFWSVRHIKNNVKLPTDLLPMPPAEQPNTSPEAPGPEISPRIV